MTPDEKIEWLRGYRTAALALKRQREELERWRSIAEKITPALSPVRYTVADGSRVETAVEKMDTLRGALAAKLGDLVRRRMQIEQAIEAVEDERLRLVLRYRYIDGLSLGKIAQCMGVSTRWAIQMHENAITSLDFTL